MRKTEDKSRDLLTPEQEEFIRLLRQKAEDTPIPMAMEPSMMMSRLQPKKKVSWIKVVSPAALAVTACFIMVLAGRSSGLMNGKLPVVSDPSAVSETSTVDVPSKEESHTASVNPAVSSEISDPLPEDRFEMSPASSSSSELSSEESVPAPAGNSPVRNEEPSSQIEENPVPDNGSTPAASVENSEPSGDGESQETPITPPPAYTPGGEGSVASYLPRDNSNEDYSGVYEAIQSAATPENANQRYATGVLSAGISTDGLQTVSEKAAISAGDGYFYLARQHSNEITVVKGNSGTTATFEVEFETPDFKGLTVDNKAITSCEVVNGRLFVAGTVTYVKNGKNARTVSALSCYDLENPTQPVLLSKVAQDGAMVGLKAVDGYLYLFSRYYPDSAAPESYPEAYVPFRYFNGKAELVPSEDIQISACSDESSIVATAFSSKDPGMVNSSLVLQGGGKNFYLGAEGLYLFGEQYLNGRVMTWISGLSYCKGQVAMVGEVSVPGILNRSDSPNEYGGTLRILTNSYGSTNDTSLYIFDRKLNLLGSVEGLVENQILRSVRFEKNKLFFTLYEDRNTTYALDLAFPQEMGAPYKAERSEEALQSISLRGDQVLRLTGALGRSSVTLSLNTRNGLETSETISLTGTYSENNIGLMSYEGGKYVSLTFSDSGTQKQAVLLYAIEDDQLRQVLKYECSSWYGGFESYLQNGRFYVVSIAETVVYDVATGTQVEVIQY